MIKMVVGITGKIGSGKSTLLDRIAKDGFKIIDMDKIGHEILKEAENIIRKKFNIVKGDLRSSLRKIVFKDKEKLRKLNSILHPKMKERLKEKLLQNKEKVVFVEAAILFEMRISDLMDKIVYLDVDDSVAVERVSKRSNLSKDEIINIIKNQTPYEKLKKFVDVYINTSTMKKDEVYNTLINKLNLEVKNAC
jgi:dephospho-CoA kinase